MDTANVYALIDGERTYQDRRWPGHVHDVPTYLTYMWFYYRKAEAAECGTAYQSLFDARETVRKIAALAVVCMEQNGAQAPHTLPGEFRQPETLTRAQIYEFVEKEETDPHEFTTHLALIRYLLMHADEGWSRSWTPQSALQVVRRIAAVCVRCMEEYETMPRPRWGGLE